MDHHKNDSYDISENHDDTGSTRASDRNVSAVYTGPNPLNLLPLGAMGILSNYQARLMQPTHLHGNITDAADNIINSWDNPDYGNVRCGVHAKEPHFDEDDNSFKGVVTSFDSEQLVSFRYRLNLGLGCQRGFKAHKPNMPNQDSFAVFDDEQVRLIAVFDGHGASGHWIAHLAGQHLSQCVFQNQELRDQGINLNKDFFGNTVTRIFHEVIADVKDTCDERGYDMIRSGCTVSMVYLRQDQNRVYCAWVGDSSICVGTVDAETQHVLKMSKSHTAKDPTERARILTSGGELRMRAGDEIPRVYHSDTGQPGLAMTRAFGDLGARPIGVLGTPEFKVLGLDDQIIFVMVATDGVTDVMKEPEAVSIIRRHGVCGVQDACDEILHICRERWRTCHIKGNFKTRMFFSCRYVYTLYFYCNFQVMKVMWMTSL